jgi:hypothetical protein
MFPVGSRTATAVVALALWLCPPALWAGEPIQDDAGFFSTDARQRNQQIVEQLAKDFRVDIVIETFSVMPAKWKEQRKKSGDDKVAAQWAQENATAKDIDGVYILICREPPCLHVYAGPDADERGFGTSRAARLERQMRRALGKHRNDAALDDAVSFIAGDLQRNEAGQRGLWFLAIIGAGIAFWLLLVLIRSRMKQPPVLVPTLDFPEPPRPFTTTAPLATSIKAQPAPWTSDL